MTTTVAQPSRRIGFVSTRLAGTDGVSLETNKWCEILKKMGHECFFIAGECDHPAECSAIVPEAHFRHPSVKKIHDYCFSRNLRSPKIASLIHETAWVIREKLQSAFHRFGIDLIIAENCMTIPMNIPLGLALVEIVMETGLGCIAHHHDFVWERERFMVNAVDDKLVSAFPPPLPQIQHVVINSQAARDFSRRTGLSCRVIPNVMDFDNPPTDDTEPGAFRRAIGLAPEDILILQPTRVVQRKGIEHSIELLHQLANPHAKLVITHASGDEGDTYAERIRRYAGAMKVPLIFAEPSLMQGSAGAPGDHRLSIDEAYREADFVTYPSTYEGFGNAFLEAIYFSKPLLCNRYAIYRTDIEPVGFKVVLMDGFLTDDVVDRVRRLLADSTQRLEMVQHNYTQATRFFSYRRAAEELTALLSKPRLAPPTDD